MASNSDVILEEIEALQAIMMDDVNIINNSSGNPSSVEIIVKPATAENIEQQHVRVTLIVNLTQNYPDKSPHLELRNPRGIDDDVLRLINMECKTRCEEYLGLPVIYELTELVREKLTANNTPSCPCAICLFQFTDNDHFTKTRCFHYFHSNCLGRYILNCEETAAIEERENQQPAWMAREKRLLLCPVCREPLNEEVNGLTLLENPPPEEGEFMTDFDPLCPEIKTLQENMKTLYLHQKSKGGIIDLEEEKNKFLISASESFDTLNNGGNYNEENVDGSLSLLSDTQEAKHEVSSKADRQNHVQNQGKGARGRGGSYNQNKKSFSSNNYWHNGSREKYNRRGGKNYSGKPNQPSNESNLLDSSSSYVSKNQTKSAGLRYGSEKPDRCNSNLKDYVKVPNCPNHDFGVEEHKKMGKRNFYKNFHQKGGGRGNSSRGGPPPGYSELEKNIRPHATS